MMTQYRWRAASAPLRRRCSPVAPRWRARRSGSATTGWRLACNVAAALAFVSTLTTSLNQQLKMGDHLSQGYQCVSRLSLLDVNIAVGWHSWEEISREYGDIATTCTEYFA